MSVKGWTIRNGKRVSKKPVAPGVYLTQEPEVFYLRKRVVSRKTGQMKEVSKMFQGSLEEAKTCLQTLIERAQGGGDPTPARRKMLFSSYAVDLLDRKTKTGAHTSKATQRSWAYILVKHLVPRFGDYFLTQITRQDLISYRDELAELVTQEKLASETGNTRLNVLFTILNAATAELELPVNPTAGVKKLSKTRTYSHEEPNALTAEQAGDFLAALKKRFPQHYAFSFLTMMTGLRPSHVRPLRCRGKHSDVLWDKGLLLIRRSHTIDQDINNRTKTGHDQVLPVPKEVLDILKWHVETFHTTKAQQEGELLFCKEDGSLIEVQALRHPVRKAAKDAGLTFKLTPKGAGRRSHTSMSRAAAIPDHVLRSISGHHSTEMTDLYTSVPVEARQEAVAKIVSLVQYREQLSEKPHSHQEVGINGAQEPHSHSSSGE